MSPSYPARTIARVASIFLTLLALAGCLPAGESDTDGTAGADDGTGVVETDHQLTGSVGDGPIVSATIVIRADDGAELATVSSGATASFDVTVKTRGSHYPLRIDAIDGTDLVTSTAPDFVLKSAVLRPGNRSVANINPFTTFAIEVAVDMPGGRTEANISQALDIVTSDLNAGLSSMADSAILNRAIDAGNIAEVTRASEALGEAVRRTRDALNSVGNSATGDTVVAAVASDLSDGDLDGRGGPGTDARMTAVFGVAFAEVMLETMQNELRVNGVTANAAMDAAMAQVFAGTPSPTLADLRVTAGMLAAARRGVIAANWIQPAAGLDAILAEIAQVSAGMSSSDARTVLATDPGITLSNSLINVAAASTDDINTVNAILESGTVPSDNNAPVISGSPDTSVDTGIFYSFAPQASDADGDTLSFTISGRPAWAQFNPATGELQGVPAGNDAGVYPGIVISVSDGDATASLPAFTISVAASAANTPPVITGTPDLAVDVDALYSFTPQAADADGDALSFSVSGLPGWASFDSATGELSGVPGATDAGNFSNIVISVSDGQESASLPAFSISVVSVDVNTPPVISGTPLLVAYVDQGYDFTPSGFDADGDALSYSIVNRPNWASFVPSSGRLTGTPDVSDTGVYAGIQISVSDGQSTVSLPAFTITVVAPEPVNTAPQISGVPSLSVDAGSAYSFQPQASDADGDPLTFSISGRPGWASFNSSSGRLSGTPDAGDVGTWSGITISVSDGEDSASLPPFSIDVLSVVTNTAPQISGTPSLSVDVGSGYSFQPQASDADGDTLTFSISGRPGWASFNTATGRLSGTPGAGDVGSWSGITISVSDGEDSASLAPFSIDVLSIVTNTAPQISGTPPAVVVAGTTFDFTPNASDADGDALSFSVNGLPAWATFDTNSGRISGTPGDGDVATYSGISITVSDGEDSATLGPFSVTVEAAALGSATLNWVAPTQNVDGTTLTDLAGYRIYWGTQEGNYTESVTLNNAGLTTYVVENLASGRWYFVSTALNSAGEESDYSNSVSRLIP